MSRQPHGAHGHRSTVHSVTSAPISPRDDQHARMVRYFTSMGIRTLCFVLAVVFIVWLHWMIIGWICVFGAVILPYIAVVMANASRGRGVEQAPPPTPTGYTQPQLGEGKRGGNEQGGTQPGGQHGTGTGSGGRGGPQGPAGQQGAPHPSRGGRD